MKTNLQSQSELFKFNEKDVKDSKFKSLETKFETYKKRSQATEEKLSKFKSIDDMVGNKVCIKIIAGT